MALSRLDSVPSIQTQRNKQKGPPARVRPAAPVFHAVPPYVGSAPFTGRAGDLAGLDDWGRSADPVMAVEAIGGTGKSALTWQWAQDRAPTVIDGLASRLWWTFYDGSASMTRFLQELLSYISAQPEREIRRLPQADLADEVLTGLRSRPYLVVLDGFERLLAAYHRFDPSKVRDEEAEAGNRSLIETLAGNRRTYPRSADPGPRHYENPSGGQRPRIYCQSRNSAKLRHLSRANKISLCDSGVPPTGEIGPDT